MRRLLWQAGCRYRKDVGTLPGRPDIVFTRARVVVFCDGDFWHGKDWPARHEKLRSGSNADYWIAKVRRNIERDRQQEAQLRADGWTVLRFWESEILADATGVVTQVLRAVGPARGT
ncbi:MAG: very short patch repair endonuclease [Holophagales bacterium]|nr:MAG: very short patch repair endonuclease [Holophagales bacterium]